jgi:hypothetical protein
MAGPKRLSFFRYVYFDLSTCVPYSRIHGNQQGFYLIQHPEKAKRHAGKRVAIVDDEVIAAANEHGIAMIFTGMRHFRH